MTWTKSNRTAANRIEAVEDRISERYLLEEISFLLV